MNFLHELVPLLTPFVPLAAALVWPVTTLIILYWFKDGLREVIKQIAEAKVGDKLYFKFWQAKTDLATAEPLPALAESTVIEVSVPAGVRWDRVADLFWLGADLDWTGQAVLRAAPKERIIHGLTQCYHHASQCGFVDTVPGKQLAALKTQVSGMPEESLDRQWRANFAEQLSTVVKGFSGLTIEKQPDFRPSP